MSRSPMTGDQIAALTYEVDAIARLLAHGLDVLRRSTYTRGTAPVTFACLGGGVERLLKATFGLMERDEGRPWPSANDMKTTHSHKIYDLDGRCRKRLGERAVGSPAAGGDEFIERLRLVEDDVTIKVLLGALQREATGSRFFNLDILASSPQKWISAVDGWIQFENRLAKSDCSVLSDLSSEDYQDRGQRRLNELAAVCFDRWRAVYFDAWSSGLVGEEAKWVFPHMQAAWLQAVGQPLANA